MTALPDEEGVSLDVNVCSRLIELYMRFLEPRLMRLSQSYLNLDLECRQKQHVAHQTSREKQFFYITFRLWFVLANRGRHIALHCSRGTPSF